MTPRIADLGHMPALTAGFRPFSPEQPKPTADQPFPSRPGPCHTTRLDDADRDNAAKLGHLQYLLGEMQHIAGRDGCPPDLANLIDQARQVTDLRRAA